MISVEHIDTFIVDVPTVRPHVLAMATMHSQSIVLVRIRTSDGVEGLGEGTTIGSLSYGDESPEGIKLAIDTYIAPIIGTCDVTRVGSVLAKSSLSHVTRAARWPGFRRSTSFHSWPTRRFTVRTTPSRSQLRRAPACSLSRSHNLEACTRHTRFRSSPPLRVSASTAAPCSRRG